MSIKNFDQLTRNEKERLIIDKAIPVNSISNDERRIILYSLSIHFIEVTIKKVNAEVELIQLVKGKELDKYISNVRMVFTGEDEWN